MGWVLIHFSQPSWAFSTPSSSAFSTSRRSSSSDINPPSTPVEVDKDDDDSPSSSPWKSSQWRWTLNIGREEGSWMPEEWAQSGGRLVLPLDVEITSDRLALSKSEQDPILKERPMILQTLTNSTYITTKGQQTATFASQGGWRIRSPPSENLKQGWASSLRGFLDLTSSIERNDICLDAGERIYLTANCWREQALETAARRLQPITQEYERAQERLEKALAHETGDRRLDGTNLVDTLAGMRDTAQLVIERDEALRRLEEARTRYPSQFTVDTIPEGPWPGQVEWLSIEPRYLMVRRDKLLGEEYHVIGTWSVEPLLDDADGEEAEGSSIF